MLQAVGLPGLRGRPRTRRKHLADDEADSTRPAFAPLRRCGTRSVIPPRRGGDMGKGYRFVASRQGKMAIGSAAVTLASLRQRHRPLRPSEGT